jgi:hypothetical protein
LLVRRVFSTQSCEQVTELSNRPQSDTIWTIWRWLTFLSSAYMIPFHFHHTCFTFCPCYSAWSWGIYWKGASMDEMRSYRRFTATAESASKKFIHTRPLLSICSLLARHLHVDNDITLHPFSFLFLSYEFVASRNGRHSSSNSQSQFPNQHHFFCLVRSPLLGTLLNPQLLNAQPAT